MPPRLRLAKNTFSTAYAIRITQNRIMMGLVMTSRPKWVLFTASESVWISLSSVTMSWPTSPMLLP